MSDERRKARRERCFLGARIVMNDGMSTLSCTMRNHSSGGAMLSFTEPAALPSEFPLVVDKHGAQAAAGVVWRAGRLVGVRFREEGAMAAMRAEADGRERSLDRTRREATLRRDTAY